jgi:hypothetical protein
MTWQWVIVVTVAVIGVLVALNIGAETAKKKEEPNLVPLLTLLDAWLWAYDENARPSERVVRETRDLLDAAEGERRDGARPAGG